MSSKPISLKEKYDIKELNGNERCELCESVDLFVADVIGLDFHYYKFLCRRCYLGICGQRLDKAEREKRSVKEKKNAWKKKIINLPVTFLEK
jgi:hypothetical protein